MFFGREWERVWSVREWEWRRWEGVEGWSGGENLDILKITPRLNSIICLKNPYKDQLSLSYLLLKNLSFKNNCRWCTSRKFKNHLRIIEAHFDLFLIDQESWESGLSNGILIRTCPWMLPKSGTNSLFEGQQNFLSWQIMSLWWWNFLIASVP